MLKFNTSLLYVTILVFQQLENVGFASVLQKVGQLQLNWHARRPAEATTMDLP